MANLINNYFFNYQRHISSKVASGIICIFCIVHLLAYMPDIYNIFSSHGFISANFEYRFLYPTDPRLSWLIMPMAKLGVSEDTAIMIIVAIYFLTLMANIFDYARFYCSLAAMMIHSMMVGSSYMFIYGGDRMESFLLFANVILCMADLCKPETGRVITSFAFRMVQIHLFAVYFFSGFGKILGMDWWNGNAMWYVVNTFGTERVKQLSLMASKFPFVFILAGWAIMIIELAYPLLTWKQASRRIILWFVIMMHLMIALVMHLYFFAIAMIVFNALAFGKDLKIKSMSNIYKKILGAVPALERSERTKKQHDGITVDGHNTLL